MGYTKNPYGIIGILSVQEKATDGEVKRSLAERMREQESGSLPEADIDKLFPVRNVSVKFNGSPLDSCDLETSEPVEWSMTLKVKGKFALNWYSLHKHRVDLVTRYLITSGV